MPGFGARTRTTRTSVLPEHRARQALDVVVIWLAGLEAEPEQVVDRIARGDRADREERRPVELPLPLAPVLEQRSWRDPPRVRRLVAVGARLERRRRGHGEVPRVEPDRNVGRRDP